jgi:hypothetical protein
MPVPKFEFIYTLACVNQRNSVIVIFGSTLILVMHIANIS